MSRQRKRFYHLTERPQIPSSGFERCWVCHDERREKEPGVYDADIRAYYHQACGSEVRAVRKIYDRSLQGRFRPPVQVRRLTYGVRCPTCSEVYPKEARKP